jgi:hypothetical protein
MAHLVIKTLEQQAAEGALNPPLVADRRLFLDATKDVVLEDGHPDCAFLLACARGTIPSSEVKRLGLVMVDGKVQQRPKGSEKAAEPAADKQAEKPADKQKSAPENKGKK